MKVSIVLLLKNGSKYLPRLIDALKVQENVDPFELVVVDSGSTDGGLEYINSIKVSKYQSIKVIKLFKIKPEEFGHGKTRNYAISKTTGEIVVFISQDAIPIEKNWLETLIRPLSDEKVAGVFGSQVPYQETGTLEKYFYSHTYTNEKRLLTKNDTSSFSSRNLFFSNVNGAAKRTLLDKYPFREDLLMSEDQYWGREVLSGGYKIIYEPEAAVWHSHNYNLKELFFRYFRIGYSQRQINLQGDVMVKGAETATELLKYLLFRKPLLIPYALVYQLVKGGAFVMGRKGFLPGWMEKRLINNF